MVYAFSRVGCHEVLDIAHDGKSRHKDQDVDRPYLRMLTITASAVQGGQEMASLSPELYL